MADMNSTGDVTQLSAARQEMVKMGMQLEQAESVISGAAGMALAIADLAMRGMLDTEENPEGLMPLLLAIQAAAQSLGAACDCHGGYLREPREWLLAQTYLARQKKLDSMEGRHHG